MKEQSNPKLNAVLSESITSSSNQTGKPSLLAFTRAVNNLVYTDLVSVQPTSQPIAALYGIRYFNAIGNMSYTTAATMGGQWGDKYKTLEEYSGGTIKAGEPFKYQGVLYIPIKDFTSDPSNVFKEVMSGNLRLASEAAETSKFEDPNSTIQETNFRLDKWNSSVKSRKLKTSITLEAIQDSQAIGVNSDKLLTDFLVTMISEDINKDILQTLINVSKRFKVKGISDEGYLDLSSSDVYGDSLLSYKLTRYVSEMASSAAKKTGFNPTYVVASSRVAAILQTAGIEPTDNPRSPGYLKKLGLDLFVDTTTPFDYAVVGIKRDNQQFSDKMESVASLVYSPYLDDGKTGQIKIVPDPDSLQENACVMTRYALSVNPYATAEDDFSNTRIQSGDDWDKLAGRSDMSMFLGVLLPPIINSDQD